MITDLQKIPYGGDYNPEQWPRDVWPEDMRLLKEAGVDILTLNVFSWAALQPSEEVYDFSTLDEIMDLARSSGMRVFLATSTGAHPAWMATRHPEILRVDFEGRKRKFGGRHNSCPNSPVFRKYSSALAGALASRYKDDPNIAAWHVSNEFGGICYCENCEKAFRIWLKEKYQTLEALNKAWNTSFWGHAFYDWDEIVVPNALSEHFEENRSMFQGISLDYNRFNSDGMLKNYKAERDAIRAVIPHAQISTNLMGFYKQLDYQKWAREMDFIGWDNYPGHEDSVAGIALSHVLMRGLKGGQPFALVEQTPGVSNWHPYSTLKRPGIMRLWSWQAVAHGADTVMFFQMRRSIGACEKYHSAVIDHVGTGDTRVFREIRRLGRELGKLGGGILGSRSEAKVAILFDWDNWWAMEFSAGPSRDLKYPGEVLKFYEALYSMNIMVDIIAVDADLSGYSLVIAPVLYMTKAGHSSRLKEYVHAGGTFVTTFFSGLVNENDLVVPGGYPGELRSLTGVWVEETDALPPNRKNGIKMNGIIYSAGLLCDIIHAEKAEIMAVYTEEFYKGTPAVTRNRYGRGEAWYVGTSLEKSFYTVLLGDICRNRGIKGILQTPEGVEVTRRAKGGVEYTFVLNHRDDTVLMELDDDYTDALQDIAYAKGQRIHLTAKDVMILLNR